MKKNEGPKLSSVHPPIHPSTSTTRVLRALVGVGLSLDPEGRKKGSDATENHSYRTT